MKTKRYAFTLAAALCAGAAITATASTASAQHRVDTVEYTGPDRGMLRTGAWTLGLSYAPALIVGIASPLPADRYLLAPVVGPWIDFAKRDCSNCEHETFNRVMLVTDGIIQGIGALEIVGSFLFVEHVVVSQPARLGDDSKQAAIKLRVVPTYTSSGYGVAALGKF